MFDIFPAERRAGTKSVHHTQEGSAEEPQLVEWRYARSPVRYPPAVEAMEERVRDIRLQKADELIWFLEHPPLYTAGISASEDELLRPGDLPVFKTGRGGRYTYHGPGQLIGYVMLDLKTRRADVRWFVAQLEAWIIEVLAELGVQAGLREGRIGVWTRNPKGQEAKIAAIGVRVRRWVTYHGFSLNIAPNLAHFEGIVPCGISQFPVTSLREMQISHSKSSIMKRFRERFPEFFQQA